MKMLNSRWSPFKFDKSLCFLRNIYIHTKFSLPSNLLAGPKGHQDDTEDGKMSFESLLMTCCKLQRACFTALMWTNKIHKGVLTQITCTLLPFLELAASYKSRGARLTDTIPLFWAFTESNTF